MKEFPIFNGEEDMGMVVPLYFLDGAEDLPYIEANDWLWLMQELWGEEGIELETNGSVATYTHGEGITMALDFYSDTIEFIDYDLFVQKPGANTLLDPLGLNSFNAAGEPSLFLRNKSFSFDRYGDVKVLRLGDYGIDLVAQDGLCLMPLQTMFDFLIAFRSGLNAFFNGQCLMITSTMDPNSEIYYAAPTGDRSEALEKYGYGELCLMLDSMYGLKEVHDIESFAQLFYEIGFDEPLSGASAEDALGRTSGGGSCMVLSASSAWGTSFKISSPYRMSFLKNGAFYDIDRGADPDVILTKPEKFYDRETLVETINSIN